MESKLDSLNAQLSDLKNFSLKLDANDLKNIKSLLNQLTITEKVLANVSIPSEITTTQKKVIKFEDKTKMVLVSFFVFSILTITGSIWFSNWRIENIKSEVSNQRKINEENRRTNEQQEWLENFFFFQKKKNPKDTQNFIKKNPIPK